MGALIRLYKFLGGLPGTIALGAALLLGGLLVVEKIGHADTRSELVSMTASWRAEAKAHAQTVANYRAAAELARKMDAANKARVEAERSAIKERITRDYEARLADARARAERLRQQLKAGANPGRPGGAPMPGVPGTPGGPYGSPAEGGFPLDDRLIATEQAIQLDALQRWVREQLTVDPNGTTRGTSRSSSEAVSH